MICDEFQPVRGEVELSGLYLGPLRDAVGEICVGVEIFVTVGTGELCSVNPSLSVVKGLKNQRRTKLPFINQITRLLVVGIDANIESREYLLGCSDIEIVVPLW